VFSVKENKMAPGLTHENSLRIPQGRKLTLLYLLGIGFTGSYQPVCAKSSIAESFLHV